MKVESKMTFCYKIENKGHKNTPHCYHDLVHSCRIT